MMERTYVLTITAITAHDTAVVVPALVGRFKIDNTMSNARLHWQGWANAIIHTVYRVIDHQHHILYAPLYKSLRKALESKTFCANGQFEVVATLRVAASPAAYSFMSTIRELKGRRDGKEVQDGHVQYRITLTPVEDDQTMINNLLEEILIECPAADCANGYSGDSGRDICKLCGGRGTVIESDRLWSAHMRALKYKLS